MGLNYVEVTVSNSNEVQQATQSIVTQCDAIYIPTDNVFASAMPIVHGVTAESKTPVICGEAGMVNSGGLATLGINYYDLGYQTGLMAIRVLTGEAEPATMPIELPSDYDFTINQTVANDIELTIPAELQNMHNRKGANNVINYFGSNCSRPFVGNYDHWCFLSPSAF